MLRKTVFQNVWCIPSTSRAQLKPKAGEILELIRKLKEIVITKKKHMLYTGSLSA